MFRSVARELEIAESGPQENLRKYAVISTSRGETVTPSGEPVRVTEVLPVRTGATFCHGYVSVKNSKVWKNLVVQ